MGKVIETDILIDIDTLFDVRLEIARGLDKKSTDEFVKSGKYTERMYDEIGSIPHEIFRKYYYRRHIGHLMNAKSTNLLDNYIYLILNIEETAKPKNIFINFYPYSMDKEQFEFVMNRITDKLAYTGLNIKEVWLNYIDLFKFLKKIKYFIHYDYETFIILHSALEIYESLKHTIGIIPDIPIDKEDLINALSLFINLEPHPYKLFSPKDLPNGKIFNL